MKRTIASLFLSIALAGSSAARSLSIYTEIDPPGQIQQANGTLTGLAVEVVQEIQRRTGDTSPIEVVPWARGYLELQTLPNVALFATARTAERNALFKWVGPIDEKRYCLFVKADSTTVLKTLEDAKKLGSIGVYKDDVRDLFLTRQGFKNLDRTIDNVSNVKKLMAGRIDAFPSSTTGVAELAQSAGYKAGDLKEALPIFNVQLYIAFSRSTADVTVKAWSSAFEAMKKDKTFSRLHQKYYPRQPLPGPAITEF
jgi:polar amino acid transport system substrate-binding protein